MAAFAIPVLVAVSVGCIIRIRNLRMKRLINFCFRKQLSFGSFPGKLHHLNAFLNDVKTGGVSRSSVLDSWMNRRQGFERLEQHSDGENEPLDSNAADDSNDEIITVQTKQQGVGFNNKSTTGTFKINEGL
jgi:hypothetical protein